MWYATRSHAQELPYSRCQFSGIPIPITPRPQQDSLQTQPLLQRIQQSALLQQLLQLDEPHTDVKSPYGSRSILSSWRDLSRVSSRWMVLKAYMRSCKDDSSS